MTNLLTSYKHSARKRLNSAPAGGSAGAISTGGSDVLLFTAEFSPEEVELLRRVAQVWDQSVGEYCFSVLCMHLELLKAPRECEE